MRLKILRYFGLIKSEEETILRSSSFLPSSTYKREFSTKNGVNEIVLDFS